MLAILAAGQSQRFGDQDKLATMLGEQMLGLHVAQSLTSFACARRVVVAPSNHACAVQWIRMGYEIIANDQGADGQAVSVALAAKAAQQAGASALLICLADMPFITATIIADLITKFEQHDRAEIVAASAGQQTMPPAIFPAHHFAALASLKGDKGARELLQTAHRLDINGHHMLDIDTPEDLQLAVSYL